jgi:hypothetical protein
MELDIIVLKKFRVFDTLLKMENQISIQFNQAKQNYQFYYINLKSSLLSF